MAIKLMKTKIGVVITIIGLTTSLLANTGGEVDSANIRSDNKMSLQSGARTYMNYCLACHTLKHMRYEVLVEGLGIPEDLVTTNLMFTGDKISDHITNNIPADDSKAWFGKTPPDLTLIARVRGADWLYTYLRSFYSDHKRPFGVNNTLFKDVAMPNVLAPLQGEQVKTAVALDLESKLEAADIGVAIANRDNDPAAAEKNRAIIHEATEALAELKHKHEYFEIAKVGQLNEEEFNTVVRDLVNFLDFAAEPVKLERQALGIKVILFLLVLFMITYLLKKEYWRDVH